jgi:hypothetical protein
MEIQEETFKGSGLQQIVLPNSVRDIDGSAFIDCPVCDVSFTPRETSFHVWDCFLGDNSRESIARYFGSSQNIILPSSVRRLCKSCFANCLSLHSVFFEPQCKLVQIGESAFAGFVIAGIAQSV